MVIYTSFRVVLMVFLEGVSMPLRVFRWGACLMTVDMLFIVEGQ